MLVRDATAVGACDLALSRRGPCVGQFVEKFAVYSGTIEELLDNNGKRKGGIEDVLGSITCQCTGLFFAFLIQVTTWVVTAHMIAV